MMKHWKAWRQRGSSAAFEALVKREIPYALAFARRCGARGSDAEDIVQESLIQLAREKSDDPMRVGLRAWICRRVGLRAKMEMRSSSRRRKHERAAVRIPASADAGLETRDEVQAALDRLEPVDRDAVVLRYLHDLDYHEVAYVLGVSPTACRVRVHKAIKRLRAMLGAKAPMLIAALALPAARTEAAVFAAVAAKKTVGAGLGIKATAAAAIVAGAVTTAVMVLPDDPAPPPPPAKVARLEPPPPPTPEPRPEPKPAPVSQPKPKPQPPPTPPRKPDPKPEPEPEPKPEPPKPRRPGGLDFLALHEAGKLDATAAFWSWDDVARRVVPEQGEILRFESNGGVTEADLREVTEKTRVIAFGPGTFKVVNSARWPESFELRGAGKDKTVLRCVRRDLLQASDSFEHVRLRDFTLDGGGLLYVDGGAAVIVENVRLKAWEAQAGFAAPVGVYGRAYLGFRNCEFIGGVRRPAGGCGFSVRGLALALFDRCRFVDVEYAVAGAEASPRSRVHLLDCSFDNASEHPRNTSLTVARRGGFSRTVPRCTTARLRAVLDRTRPKSRERITGVQVLAWEGLGEPYFVVHLIDHKQVRRRVVVQGRKTIREKDLPGHDLKLPLLPGREKVYTTRPLTKILKTAWARLDLSEEAGGIVEWALNNDPGMIPCVSVVDRFDRPLASVVAATGEVQR